MEDTGDAGLASTVQRVIDSSDELSKVLPGSSEIEAQCASFPINLLRLELLTGGNVIFDWLSLGRNWQFSTIAKSSQSVDAAAWSNLPITYL